jgi:hypothetical protein
MPIKADAEMLAEHQKYKPLFGPAFYEQIDGANKKNVDDGRELTVANCWFASEYAGRPEGIAIKSTIRSLSQFVFCDPRFSNIGKVRYVDLNSHTMTHYDANKAQQRWSFVTNKKSEL